MYLTVIEQFNASLIKIITLRDYLSYFVEAFDL